MLCSKRLTYEERMARRLLGPENAASVLEAQSEDMQNTQVNGGLSWEGQFPADCAVNCLCLKRERVFLVPAQEREGKSFCQHNYRLGFGGWLWRGLEFKH